MNENHIFEIIDNDEIEEIKNQDKFRFSISQHFGLGLFIRNHFGINSHQSRALYSDILEKSDKRLLMSDDVSGYLLEELWEEIQRRY